jgi:hypothetical protein
MMHCVVKLFGLVVFGRFSVMTSRLHMVFRGLFVFLRSFL